jgi:serine/threonine-protein kinase RsbT
VTQRFTFPIETEDDIFVVRRKVRELAQSCRFDVFGISALTTAASELARNVWIHAGQGVAEIEMLKDDERSGLRLVFRDNGPGIADLARALLGGHSTAHSLGLGLAGSKRLVDDFEVETTPGKGTTVTVVKWTPY